MSLEQHIALSTSDDNTIRDDLYNQLRNEIVKFQNNFSSCTLSCIRWIRRYASCRWITCSCLCLPIWIILIPVGIVLDLSLFIICGSIFIIAFIVSLLLASCMLTTYSSSIKDICHPRNTVIYSLTKAIHLSCTVYEILQFFWLFCCGTGIIQDGAPICCLYCGKYCKRACTKATQVEFSATPCTIL